MRDRVLFLSLAVPLFVCFTTTLDALAQSAAAGRSLRPTHSEAAQSVSSGFPDKRSVAEKQEKDDRILYRAGPTDEAVEDSWRKEEEKEQRSWEMLQNMNIILEDERRSHLPINRKRPGVNQ